MLVETNLGEIRYWTGLGKRVRGKVSCRDDRKTIEGNPSSPFKFSRERVVRAFGEYI